MLLISLLIANATLHPAPLGRVAFQQTRTISLQSLDISKIHQGWGTPHAARSVDNHPIRIGGTEYKSGVGTHAVSEFRIRLNGAVEFRADVGVDDEVGTKGTVVFQVWLDGKRVWASDVMKGGMSPKHVAIVTANHREMNLVVEDAEDGIDSDHADWADAALVTGGRADPIALTMDVQVEPPIPIFYGDPPGVRINGPRVIGCTPGRPFLFKIPVTGMGPGLPANRMVQAPYAVKGALPPGLTLNARTGVISGSVERAGTYRFVVQVHSDQHTDSRGYTVVAGDHRLALTPPMGWNSWNVWAGAVSADKVRASADAFIKAGLADYGYQYVNIDDTWEGTRDASGMIQTNRKFGDMKSLADYTHSLGLKLGIYSGPGPKTCAGFEASYHHELDDAKQYANWGIDYLKYDWCSYGEVAPRNPTKADMQKPYIVMRDALDQVNRDIVYSLCQYGMGDVFLWGHSVAGGNLWRTTGDINDSWKSMSDIGFSHNFRSTFVQPGGWNDPDMLVVGRLGWGPNPRPTRLTPNEQITHITMWSLLAAPLIIGCDLTKLDKFTKAVLCNHDVIEVDQDPLGQAATQRIVEGKLEVWARPLWDGTTAVGLFNRGSDKAVVKCDLARLGYRSPQAVRDLWQMKNLPGKTMLFQATVPAHGAVLFKVGSGTGL